MIAARDRRWAHGAAGPLALAGLVLLATATYLARPPDVPPLQADSQSYLDFSEIRTPGYPVFLRLVLAVAGNVDAVPVAQLALLSAATLAAMVALARATGSLLPAVALGALVLGNVMAVRYAFTVLTEALSMAVVLLALALGLGHGQRSCTTTAAGISALAAVLFEIRPASVPFVVLPAALALADLTRGRAVLRLLLAWTLPAAAVVVAGAVATHARHGVWHTGQSFLGSNLIARAALAAEPRVTGTRDDETAHWIAQEVAPERRVILETGNWGWRSMLGHIYGDVWTYDAFPARLAQRAAARGETMDAYARDLALDLIRANPGPYATDVLVQLAAAWSLPDLMTASEAEAFQRWTHSVEPLPRVGSFPQEAHVFPAPLVFAVRAVLGASLAGSLLALLGVPLRLVAGLRPSPLAITLWGAAAALHGSLLLVALLQYAIPRYVLGQWPLISFVLVGAATWLGGRMVGRRAVGVGWVE